MGSETTIIIKTSGNNDSSNKKYKKKRKRKAKSYEQNLDSPIKKSDYNFSEYGKRITQ